MMEFLSDQNQFVVAGFFFRYWMHKLSKNNNNSILEKDTTWIKQMYPLWLAFTFLLEKPKPNRDFVTKTKKSIKRPSSKSCDNIFTLLIA